MALYVFIIIVFPSPHSIVPTIHMYMCKLYSCSHFFFRKPTCKKQTYIT